MVESSCDQGGVQFVEQLRKVFAKQLVRSSQTAFLHKGSIVEVIRLDAEAGANMVLDQMQPSQLFRAECGRAVPALSSLPQRRDAAATLSATEPFVEPFGDGLRQRVLIWAVAPVRSGRVRPNRQIAQPVSGL